MRSLPLVICLLALAASTVSAPDPTEEGLTLSWADNILTVRSRDLPGGAVKVWYLEAFCRPGSTARDWGETVIPHRTKLVQEDPDGRRIRLRSTLVDGVIVEHDIRAGRDEVDFRLTAANPTRRGSQAHWAQPCVRVDAFTGVKPMRNSDSGAVPGRYHMLALRLPNRWPCAGRDEVHPGQALPDHVGRRGTGEAVRVRFPRAPPRVR
jgi:hypothetical protein